MRNHQIMTRCSWRRCKKEAEYELTFSVGFANSVSSKVCAKHVDAKKKIYGDIGAILLKQKKETKD